MRRSFMRTSRAAAKVHRTDAAITFFMKARDADGAASLVAQYFAQVAASRAFE